MEADHPNLAILRELAERQAAARRARGPTVSDAETTGCLGKEAFATLAEVLRARDNHHRRSRTFIDHYKCNFCPAYHLGRPSRAAAFRKPRPQTVCTAEV